MGREGEGVGEGEGEGPAWTLSRGLAVPLPYMAQVSRESSRFRKTY